MSTNSAQANKAFVLKAFDTLFNQRDYAATAEFWSSNYIQHSAHIGPGREGLFNLVRCLPATLRYGNPVPIQHQFLEEVSSMDKSLTTETAQAIVLPWYGLFNVKTRGNVRDTQQQVLTADYQSSSGFLPTESWGLETSIAVVENFARSIPDLEFKILELLVSGDRVVVRGEVTGTPSGELFGVPHSGKSFRILALDLHTISGGKISRTFHMENWLSALGQLKSQ